MTAAYLEKLNPEQRQAVEHGTTVDGSHIAGPLLVIAGALYVIVRHRANIQRLLAGTEPRLGQSTADVKAEASL